MDENRKLILAALVIVFGSNTGSILNAYNPHFRSDAFTGLEAAKMKESLINNHRKDADSFRIRIEIIEYKLLECQKIVSKKF